MVERTTGLLRTFDKDMEQNARRQSILDLNLAARESGILIDAETKAKAQLTNLFGMLGFSQVDIKSR